MFPINERLIRLRFAAGRSESNEKVDESISRLDLPSFRGNEGVLILETIIDYF